MMKNVNIFILVLVLVLIQNTEATENDSEVVVIENQASLRCVIAMNIVLSEVEKNKNKNHSTGQEYFDCIDLGNNIEVGVRPSMWHTGGIGYLVDVENRSIISKKGER